jgi:hypothetical protein
MGYVFTVAITADILRVIVLHNVATFSTRNKGTNTQTHTHTHTNRVRQLSALDLPQVRQMTSCPGS